MKHERTRQAVLDALRASGLATPAHVAKTLGWERANAGYQLRQLAEAGYAAKHEPSGAYYAVDQVDSGVLPIVVSENDCAQPAAVCVAAPRQATCPSIAA